MANGVWSAVGLVVATVLASACSAGEPTTGTDDELNGRSYVFVDTNPDVPLGSADRAKLQAALAKLDRVAKRGETPLRRALAAETLARIESGDVRLGSIAGSRGIDRWHMCRDHELPACDGVPPLPDDRIWLGDKQVAETLERELAGYMWGNNLYFTLKSTTDPIELAATLIHEVNHVLNRSECRYYRNIDTHEVEPDLAFVEEYRAFLSECYFTRDTSASPESCNAAAMPSTVDYGFAADLARVLPGRSRDGVVLAKLIVGAEEGRDAAFGRLVPRKADWPASFGACAAR